MKVEISKLTIEIDNQTVVLSLAESKALFEKLNEIFGPKYTGYPWSYGQINSFPGLVNPAIGPTSVTTTSNLVEGQSSLTVDMSKLTNNTLTLIGE